MLLSCVEPYAPASITNAPHLLVVDGFFNATDGEVNVKLSRTISLTANETPPREIGATVVLEDSDGGSVNLIEVVEGEYMATGLTANAALKYRLRIVTGGKEYLCDYVPVKETPPIENINFATNTGALAISVSTSDPTGESKFYRWTFSETYQYKVIYQSSWILANGTARPRTPSEYIHQCWRTDKSNSILVATSTGFSQDRITDFPITKVTRGALALQDIYSIEVKQQALTAEGYAYWQGLYKTTEDVGGLFDPLPGQISGNFYNATDTKEVVVGFFSAATITKKRIFITHDDLPENFSTYTPPYCLLDTLDLEDVPIASPQLILYNAVYSQGFPVIIGYTFTDAICIDCRYHGGVTTKPDFWP
jgi:hypothetical protein